jgi:hypothetical protein
LDAFEKMFGGPRVLDARVRQRESSTWRWEESSSLTVRSGLAERMPLERLGFFALRPGQVKVRRASDGSEVMVAEEGTPLVPRFSSKQEAEVWKTFDSLAAAWFSFEVAFAVVKPCRSERQTQNGAPTRGKQPEDDSMLNDRWKSLDDKLAIRLLAMLQDA